ncbi:MAG: UDP-N-acetylglucosamine 1-carboxyvinyltransferase [bacterium]|nr:UDP-N-acetylglucosamine 1-carboxyvinyltransferase [bacterium]
MTTANEKIASLIYQIRKDRGLTQAEFAKQLKTSQSAVNRIEHGGQNLSIDMLARISDVLNKPLISISDKAVNLRIHGGKELKGEIELKRSKNAAVALLCASILNRGVTKFKSFPRIEEVFRIIEVLQSIGVEVKWNKNNDIEIRRPAKLQLENIDAKAARKTRSVLMFLGPLLHESKDFKIPYAGGCKLGLRTVSPHLFALQDFGMDIEAKIGFYKVKARKKKPEEVVLYESGNTVTNNILMAAARTEGVTKIIGASADYMVQDLCLFLMKLGVKIEGFGSNVLIVHGVGGNIKKNATYAPTEDPIEAMFFVSAAIVTNSKLTIKRVPIDWLKLEFLKLEKMGLKYKVNKEYLADNGTISLIDVTIEKHNHKLLAPAEKIHPNLWPGINPDNIPYFALIATVAHGRTLIHDWMFENRAIYFTELTRIGANVELVDPHRVYVSGPTNFTAADLVTPPALRPASLLLIGMMAANGVSTLRNVYTINRGYEDLSARLNSIGANIEVIHEI